VQGMLSENNVIAVKQLFMKTQQASIDFINEIVLITNLQHRNLVKLRGYCLNGKEMLLVYDYIDNADLGKLLLCKSIPTLL
jgi:serine/threonine protein kinase